MLSEKISPFISCWVSYLTETSPLMAFLLTAG